MKLWVLGCVFSTISLFGSTAQSIKDSIVKVYSTAREYSYKTPWSPPTTERYSGSGFIIEGNLILTNAHVVADASFIEIQSASSNEKYEAFVKFIGHDCDLAVLEVEDASFFEGKSPLPISNHIASQKEEVQVYGFPMGGTGLSITKGIVSRIEMDFYAHSDAFLLVSQIDAPINPGNSGGPVIAGGEVVGIAHQGFMIGQNIGYMIPVPIIQHFLKEINEGKYQGFPVLPLKTQIIRNPAMREYYGLEENVGGLLVTYIPENYFLYDIIKPGDVLLGVDGHPIDRYGYIDYEAFNFSLPFEYLIIMKYFGDQMNLEVLREGERLALSAQVDFSKRGEALVESVEYDKPPTYFILGGMIFQPLVGNIFDCGRDFDDNFLFVDFLYYFLHGKVKEGRDEIIVLSRVLSDMVNTGYQDIENEIVTEVNGHRVQNMHDLIEAFETCQDPYFIITTKNNTEIILDREKVLERNPKILQRYFISHDRSIDLRE